MTFKFDMFRSVTMGAFKSIAEFQEMVEAQMQEVKHLDRSRIIDEFKAVEPDDPNEVGMILAERDTELAILDRKFAVTYPRLCRYSFLTTLFMHVEINLKSVCDEIAKRNKLKYRVSEFQGKTVLERAKVFLNKEASLPSILSSAWEPLSHLQKIRDCIVHTGGRVADSRDKHEIEHLIKLNLGLSITPPMFPDLAEDDFFVDADDGLLQIEPVFCAATLEQVKSLFTEIFESSGCFGPEDGVWVEDDQPNSSSK